MPKLREPSTIPAAPDSGSRVIERADTAPRRPDRRAPVSPLLTRLRHDRRHRERERDPPLPASLPAAPAIIKRGPFKGLPQRPQTDRERMLTLRDLARGINAIAFAAAIGRPLNNQVTIVLKHAHALRGIRPPYDRRVVARFRARLLERLRAHLVEATGAAAYLWTGENSGDQWKGLHFHIAVHLASSCQRPALWRAMSAHGFDFDGVDLGERGGWTPKAWSGLARYVLKRCDHRDFTYLSGGESVQISALTGIQSRGTDFGVVPGQRLGTSHAISRAARAAAGWQELKHPEEWGEALHDLGGYHRPTRQAA